MESRRPPSDNDSIVFPDQLPSQRPVMDDTTTSSVTSSPGASSPSSSTALIVIIVVVVSLLACLLVFLIYRRYRRQSRAAKDKLMTEGYPHISLPTLGTQYELNSLLSINTIGRKSSAVSGVSQATEADKQQADVFDGRVSRYIDADVTNCLTKDDSFSEDPRNFTFQTILDMTSENVLNDDLPVNPPKAESEQFLSRPMSVVEDSLTTPGLQLTPPSPVPVQDKERPKSDNLETPPHIPIKVIKQATSERVLAVVPQSDLSRLVGSDSRLESQAPSVPPKVRPLVPPKQNINKSQEDINRINKKHINQGQETDTDEDYDIPAPSRNSHEYEEYDEPCPMVTQAREDDKLDYDDPVQTYTE